MEFKDRNYKTEGHLRIQSIDINKNCADLRHAKTRQNTKTPYQSIPHIKGYNKWSQLF